MHVPHPVMVTSKRGVFHLDGADVASAPGRIGRHQSAVLTAESETPADKSGPVPGAGR